MRLAHKNHMNSPVRKSHPLRRPNPFRRPASMTHTYETGRKRDLRQGQAPASTRLTAVWWTPSVRATARSENPRGREGDGYDGERLALMAVWRELRVGLQLERLSRMATPALL